jgi:hypothetical protein
MDLAQPGFRVRGRQVARGRHAPPEARQRGGGREEAGQVFPRPMLSGPGHIVGVAEPTAPDTRPGAATGVTADHALLLRDPPLPGRRPRPAGQPGLDVG